MVDGEKRKHPDQKLATVIAVNLGEGVGGHYAAVFYEKEKGKEVVQLFDSMQAADKKKGGGYYTAYFKQLASAIFKTPNVKLPDCISEEFSLQYTGGFAQNPTYPLHIAGEAVSEKDQHAIMVQSTESQNHFCYLWAIWRLQMMINGFPIDVYVKQFSSPGNDPLIAIKRYAWYMLYALNLRKELGRYEEFFNIYFTRIWANIPFDDKLSPKFQPYQIPMQAMDRVDVNVALQRSFDVVELRPLPPTQPDPDDKRSLC